MGKRLVANGNKAMKRAPFDHVSWRTFIGEREYVKKGIERFVALHEAVGDCADIAIDKHWRMNMATAIFVADRLRPYNPFWLEAPISEHKPKLLKDIRVRTGLRIAGGEMQPGAEYYLPLIHNNCLDVYMPDIRCVGGITGLLKSIQSELSDYQFVIDNGFFAVPDKPGLGVNLNLDLFKEHPYKKAKLLHLFIKIG